MGRGRVWLNGRNDAGINYVSRSMGVIWRHLLPLSWMNMETDSLWWVDWERGGRGDWQHVALAAVIRHLARQAPITRAFSPRSLEGDPLPRLYVTRIWAPSADVPSSFSPLRMHFPSYRSHMPLRTWGGAWFSQYRALKVRFCHPRNMTSSACNVHLLFLNDRIRVKRLALCIEDLERCWSHCRTVERVRRFSTLIRGGGKKWLGKQQGRTETRFPSLENFA